MSDKYDWEKRVKRFLDDMTKRGIAAAIAVPPLYRLIWLFGFRARPPVYQSFRCNALAEIGHASAGAS